MLDVLLSNSPIQELNADIELVLVFNKEKENHPFIANGEIFDKAYIPSQDDHLLLLEQKRVIVGCDRLDQNLIASAIATTLRALERYTFESFKIASYSNSEGAISGIIKGFELGSYRFDTFKNSDKEKTPLKLTISTEDFSGSNLDIQELAKELKRAQALCEGINLTRQIINMPPNKIYPKTLAKECKKIAKNSALEIEILTKKDIKKESMNALLAVAKASSNPPRVIKLSYKPKNAVAKVALVGKGLTYDSGGLSLKPADFMVTMKSDKSGAAAVIGAMSALSELEIPVEVHGFIGAVENMIGGNAYKPDDILIAKNNKSIEIRNTDAEGRLVLADLLCYAQEQLEADYIIDFATLTGACVVGVGEYSSGIMSYNKQLKQSLFDSTIKSGELASMLEFNRHLSKAIDSKVADVCNIANTRYGGALTAGEFLYRFIEEKNQQKWAHIDIAGPAYVEKAWGVNPYGASGAGVALILEFLESLKG